MSTLPRTPQADPVRLFYGLWPDAHTREAIMRMPLPPGGRPTRIENLHLTLLFMGDQPRTRLPALIGLLDALPTAPVRFSLDRLGVFRKPRILWAGMPASPEITALHAALVQGIAGLGIATAALPAFRPHVTLMRSLPEPDSELPRIVEPVHWHTAELVLAASHALPAGARYEVLGSRKLID